MNDIIENLDIEEIKWGYEQPVKKSFRKINDYEESILSCLLQKPDLMNELIVSENDFYKYRRIFRYFKLFYETFNCLDLVLMVNKIKTDNRHILVEVYDKLIDFEPATSCFRLYQEGLIEYNKEYLQKQKKEKAENDIIELTLKLSNKQIILDEYFKKIEEIKKEFTDNE